MNIPIVTDPAPKRAPTLGEVKAKRRDLVDRFGILPYQIRPILEAVRGSVREGTKEGVRRVSEAVSRGFPSVRRGVAEATSKGATAVVRWYERVVVGRVSSRAESSARRSGCSHGIASEFACAMAQPDGATRGNVCGCLCHEAMRKEFAEVRDSALANAAMVAYDMGHPEIRRAINQLIPPGPRRPDDTPPGGPYDSHPMSVADGVGG